MKRNILIIANYFYPDVASLGQIITDYCFELKGEFNFTIIAAIPNYSKDIILDENVKRQKFYVEEINGISVKRIVVPNVNKNNKFSRIKYILSYFKNACYAIKNSNYDVILTVSQPPILGGLLGVYAKKRNQSAKLIYNIQDFNPEQIAAVAYTKIPLLIPILRKLDNITLKKADKVLLVGHDQIETLNKRNSIFKEKNIVINNWTADEEIIPLGDKNDKLKDFRQEYGLDNKFTIMYSGNIGLFYDLQNIIKVTSHFKERKNIQFIFIGEGAVKADLMQYINENNITNVSFFTYLPKDKLPISLNAPDIHLVVNAKGIKGVSVPSKLYGVMAAGKAVLGVLEEQSEARIIIEESKCGYCVNPGDYKGIIQLIEYFIQNQEEVKVLGQNARRYLDNNLSRAKSISKYKRLFKSL